jgi:hypothetical protein
MLGHGSSVLQVVLLSSSFLFSADHAAAVAATAAALQTPFPSQPPQSLVLEVQGLPAAVPRSMPTASADTQLFCVLPLLLLLLLLLLLQTPFPFPAPSIFGPGGFRFCRWQCRPPRQQPVSTLECSVLFCCCCCRHCCFLSQTPFPFPAPSIFGPGGFGFAGGSAAQQANSKCQLVQAGRLQPVVAIAGNPQWTCGVIVDGQLSCQQGGSQNTQSTFECFQGVVWGINASCCILV